MTVGTKGCPRFYYALLVLKQFLHIFHKNDFFLDQTYFKNRELLIVTKKVDTLLYSSLSWNYVQNLKANGQAVLLLALREHDNLWFSLIMLPVHH